MRCVQRPIEAARDRAFTLSQVPRAEHAVVIFGFGVPDRDTPTIELKRRLANAISELDEDRDAIAIVSGDAVHGPENEADAMKRWLMSHGIEGHRIITERTARFTAENANFVAPLLAKAGVERVTLVTEQYHMRRSRKLLERALAAEGLELPIFTMPAPDEHRGWKKVPALKNELTAFGRDLANWRQNRENLPFVEAELKVPVIRLHSADETAKRVAEEIAEVIRAKHDQGGAVLGLATGSTPLAVYRELIRMHHEEDLDFSRVKTFNLDEYYGLSSDHPESYHRYMFENFFDHLDRPGRAIDPWNVHIPRGDVPRDRIEEEVHRYERAIADAGGIDVQLLGIGGTGHIGFNEPGSPKDSRTRLVTLAEKTRKDAAAAFGGKDNVPAEAITMGVGTILSAKRVILMSTGAHKASITRRAVEGNVSDQIPATFLQEHPRAEFYVDEAASSQLARVRPLRPLGLVGRTNEALFAESVLLPVNGRFEKKPALIRIENGTIAEIVVDPKQLPAGTRRIKGLLAPGFIDLQNNGSYGADIARDPKEALERLVRRAPEQGVTTVLPTIVSSPLEVTTSVFDAVDDAIGLPGADIAGVHVEGPYLNPKRAGAHSRTHLRPIDLEELKSMIVAAQGKMKILTLAPELPGALDAIAISRANGIIPSAGHTDASYEEMRRAIDAELRMITHITNAMPKDPNSGLLRAILEHQETIASVVVDGIHVKQELLAELYDRLGPERLALVTDAAAPAGMPDGRYTLGDQRVEKRDGAIRVAGTETLAGSALTMDQAIATTMRLLGVDVEDAVLMATATPAKAAGLAERGEISVGRRADFVILDPDTMEVKETIVGGVTRFQCLTRGDRLDTWRLP